MSGLSCSTHLCYVMRDLSLWRVDSVVVASGLSCSVAYGILFSLPGMEPVSLAVEGGFLTTGPRGKSQVGFLTCRTVRQWACAVFRCYGRNKWLMEIYRENTVLPRGQGWSSFGRLMSYYMYLCKNSRGCIRYVHQWAATCLVGREH